MIHVETHCIPSLSLLIAYLNIVLLALHFICYIYLSLFISFIVFSRLAPGLCGLSVEIACAWAATAATSWTIEHMDTQCAWLRVKRTVLTRCLFSCCFLICFVVQVPYKSYPILFFPLNLAGWSAESLKNSWEWSHNSTAKECHAHPNDD